MAFSTTPQLGIDLNNIISVADLATIGGQPPHKLGKQVWGDDGRRYVFARAGATIAASTAVATVNPTTFVATATGGTYLSPATAMATGDHGWFSAASV